MEIELQKLSFKKSQLATFGEAELHFFILLTTFSNEISVLCKLFIFSGNPVNKNENKIEEEARSLQALFIAKLVAGKLYEGRELLAVRFVGSKVSTRYSKDQKLADALQAINKYFADAKNIIRLIRNKYAFHNADKENVLIGMLQGLPDEHIFTNYISPQIANTMFYGSEDFVLRSLLTEISPELENTADIKVPKLNEELLKVVMLYYSFIRAYLDAFGTAYKNLADSGGLELGVTEEIKLGVIDAKTIVLPYFSFGESEK